MMSSTGSSPHTYHEQFLLNADTNATVLPLSLVQSIDVNAITAHRNSLTSSVSHSSPSNRIQSILVTPSGHYMSRTSVIEEFSLDETEDSSCRICQLSADEANVGPLISPCRCAGTLKFVHQKCLAKWLEVRYWRTRTVPTCELCHYQFQRHKKLKLRRCLRCPSLSARDKRLHMMFLICLLIMSCCVATIALSLTEGKKASTMSELFSSEEGLVLVCGVVFFISFFVAAFSEIRVDHSFYRMLCDLVAHNVDWTIDEYDPGADIGKSNAVRRTGLQDCQTAV